MKNIIYHIGSNKLTNEIFIVNETVSPTHAQLFVNENNQFVIIDLLSKFGTLVNDQKISSPVILSNTDIISIGSIKFKHFDLAQAIMKYDSVNSNTNKKSIQLISTLYNKSISRNREKRVSSNLDTLFTYYIDYKKNLI